MGARPKRVRPLGPRDLQDLRPPLRSPCPARARNLRAHEARSRRALRDGSGEGAIEPRKDPLAAIDAANAVGRKLVVVGPRKDEELAAELARRGADVRGYVPKEELVDLYQRAAALVFPSRYEGFGLPVVEAMACGTPVVAASDPAMKEVAGDAAIFTDDLVDGVRRALAERERFAAAGLERAKAFTWQETARITADVYRSVLAQ